MRTKRTTPTTLAVALLVRAVLNWIMTAEAVGLILLIIVRLKCQAPFPQINWSVMCMIDMKN